VETLISSKKKKKQCRRHKYVKVISINLNKINHHQMKNLLMKWIENFFLYIIKKSLIDMIAINFYP